MTRENYAKLRQDPRWQKRRLQVMHRDDFKCIDCGDEDKPLNVHHSYYVKGRNPWEYPNWALSTLCEKCHKNRHSDPDPEEERADMDEWEQIIEWISGGNPQAVGDAWYVSALIANSLITIRQCGFTSIEAWKKIETAIESSKQQVISEHLKNQTLEVFGDGGDE